MDLEKTKKIIQSKIEAEAATKNVRSKIKSYIHEKQNVREGFEETFKPLIESQDKVKESVDKEQNELMKQLQTSIKDIIVDGINTNTIAMIPTDNLTRSYPFTFEPRRTLSCPVSSNTISEMRIYVTDSLGRPVDFNGIDWFMT